MAVDLVGISSQVIRGRILTASKINASNTFDDTAQVKPAEMDTVKFGGEGIRLELPSKSVAVFEIS